MNKRTLSYLIAIFGLAIAFQPLRDYNLFTYVMFMLIVITILSITLNIGNTRDTVKDWWYLIKAAYRGELK